MVRLALSNNVRMVFLGCVFIAVYYYIARQQPKVPIEAYDKQDSGSLDAQIGEQLISEEAAEYWSGISTDPITFQRESYGLESLSSMREEDVVHVVICSDVRTVGGMIAVVTSALFHTPGPIFFHLVLLPEDVDHVKSWLLHYYPTELAMEIIHFDASLVEGNVLVRGKRKELGSPLNFARFWLPDLLPDITRERILYIDDDALVRGNLREMRDLTLEPGHVAAFVPDTVNKMKMFLNFDNPKVANTRIKKNAMAFNAGVFLADMQEWRRQDITPKLLYWSRLNVKEDVYGGKGGGGASQPPMLIAFNNVTTALPDRWHMRHFGWKKAQKYTAEDVRGGKLLHFNGGDKPWVHRSKWFLLWYKYFLEDPSGQWDIRPDARQSAQDEVEAVVKGEIQRALKTRTDKDESKGLQKSVVRESITTPSRPGRLANPNVFLDTVFEKTLLRTLHDSVVERVLTERGLS